MMTIMNLFSRLMKLSTYNNHGDLQPQVTIYPELVHLHQLQHLLKTLNHSPNTNINLVLINSKMELHLLNKLEQSLYMLLLVYQPMYLKVMLTNHRMEDNLEIHLKEVHPEEICLEDHLLIHLLDLLDGQHLTCTCLYHHGINHMLCNLYQN
jgi:hypothetical protein